MIDQAKYDKELEEWLENTPTLAHERRALDKLRAAYQAVLSDPRFKLSPWLANVVRSDANNYLWLDIRTHAWNENDDAQWVMNYDLGLGAYFQWVRNDQDHQVVRSRIDEKDVIDLAIQFCLKALEKGWLPPRSLTGQATAPLTGD
jgi:hypothetical protein